MNRKKALLALTLLVPAPSIGTLAGMVWFPDTLLGKTVFAASKLWLFTFPAVWLVLVERGRPSLSPARHGGLWMGLASGVALGLLILLGYGLGQSLFDKPVFIAKMRELRLDDWSIYLGGAAYWILVNSVLEEYVWRWFVFRQCEALVKPIAAVILAAFFFTLHHVIALRAYAGWPVVLAASVGVFLGGVIWSFLYLRYRSIWPGYLSHALVDLVIFGLGAVLLFGKS